MERQPIPYDRPVSNEEGLTIGEGRSPGSDEHPDGASTSPQARADPALKSVPLVLIKAVRNPRRDAAARGSATPGSNSDLDGLARSLGPRDEPRLAEPPIVEEMPDGHFRLCAGERRVKAAQLAGWTDILCLVYPPMDPVRAHTLSLVENMHRVPMHPLEEISALCISRLLANADARGVGSEARSLLQEAWDQSSSGYDIIRSLERLLRESGWVKDRPDVSWKAHLDDLGISMAPWERKRKLRLLNIDPSLQEQLRELDITEAALQSLGTLEPDDQKKVVEALVANPSLAHKVRRVARARRDGFYTCIEDALAEVQGMSRPESQYPPAQGVSSSPGVAASAAYQLGSGAHKEQLTDVMPGAASMGVANKAGGDIASPEVQDAVLQILECADRLAEAMSSLDAYGRGSALPEPWGAWSRDALQFIAGLFQHGAGTRSNGD